MQCLKPILALENILQSVSGKSPAKVNLDEHHITAHRVPGRGNLKIHTSRLTCHLFFYHLTDFIRPKEKKVVRQTYWQSYNESLRFIDTYGEIQIQQTNKPSTE